MRSIFKSLTRPIRNGDREINISLPPFSERPGALKMFQHIKENPIFYKTYFKLCYDDKHLISIYDAKRAEKEHMDSNLKYHIEFFRNGLNAIIKLWLADGCQESPEEMAEVLKSEYRGR